jgi:MATE family multidrug resistance protein
LGFSGVAVGTVMAQWCGFAYCLTAAIRRHHPFSGTVASLPWKGFLALNRDLFIRSLGMIAVYIGFTILSAAYGDLMLAVSTILMKLLLVFSYFTDGFAYAGEALTGRFIGARSLDGVRSTVRSTFAWSLGVAGIFILLYGTCSGILFRLMTSDSAVVEAGRAFLPWLLLMPLIGCPAFVWDGVYIGATASKDLRNSTVLCAVGFFAAWFAGMGAAKLLGDFTPETAIHVLMAAYFVHLAVRALYLSVRYRKAVLIPTFSDISSR